jgi:hypothetical protein
MDWGALVTLAIGLVGISATIIGVAIKMTWWVGAKLDSITSNQVISLNAHEIRDQERHAENIERFARLETAILKNGHSKRRR